MNIKQYFNKFCNWFTKDSIISDIKSVNVESEIVDANTISKQTTRNLMNNTFIKIICDKIYSESQKGKYECTVTFKEKVPSNIIKCLSRKGYKVYVKRYNNLYKISINW